MEGNSDSMIEKCLNIFLKLFKMCINASINLNRMLKMLHMAYKSTTTSHYSLTQKALINIQAYKPVKEKIIKGRAQNVMKIIQE